MIVLSYIHYASKVSKHLMHFSHGVLFVLTSSFFRRATVLHFKVETATIDVYEK